MSAPPKRPLVIVCEDNAHRPFGHFGIRFAELAQGFMELGCETHVLTAQGWAHEASFGFPPDRVHRYDRLGQLILRLSRPRRWTWTRGRVRLKGVALAVSARRLAKRLRAGDALIVSVATDMDPALLTLAGGRHDWISHQFSPEPMPTARVLRWLAQAWRRLRGRRVLVALPDAEFLTSWRKQRPEQPSVVLRLAGASALARVDDARHRLGLAQDARIALVFGDRHDMKWPHTAIEAIAQRPDWTLCIVGRGADEARVAPGAPEPTNIVRMPGAISNEDRRLWYAAADVAVLSFAPDYRRNSGTLMDALSAACPVIVSDRSLAADLVRAHDLGLVFPPGEAGELALALDRIAPITAQVHAAAMTELGNAGVASDHLRAVGRSMAQ